jgi:hypothetical protein
VKQFRAGRRAGPMKWVLLFALSFQPLLYNASQFAWLWNQSMNL